MRLVTSRSDAPAPAGAPETPEGAGDPALPQSADHTLQRLSAQALIGSELFQDPSHLEDLLHTATRRCRRLVDCERVRIWIARRGGRRLVAFDFPDEGPPIERRHASHEGLAGWAFTHQESLRLATGDPRPELAGEIEPFRSGLVIPLFRRGEPFGAIECLDKRGADAFSDADFDQLEVAAESVSFALDYALLYQATERRALEKDVLLEVTRALAAPFDLDEVIEAIFKSLRQVVAYDAAAIYLVNRKTQQLEIVSESGYPSGSEQAFDLQIGQGIVGWVAHTGEAAIVPNVASDARYVAARPETRSEIAAPMVNEGRIVGVFNLENDKDDAYHEGHLELLSAFAAQAAVAVERARFTRELVEQRRIEKELAIAREIQLSFLPDKAPMISGFELAGTTRAHDEVGGDYYDFIPVTESRVGIAIADVSGKGIPAALIMAGFRMCLLAEIRNEFSIRAVMRKVNVLLHESTERNKFVTAFYGVLDQRSRFFTFSNAGHNPPILVRQDGPIEYLEDGGLALGVLPDSHYEDRPVMLRPGDVLVLYTDGVSEAESADGEQFGHTRLERCIERHHGKSATEIVARIEEEVVEWTGTRGLNDDLTLVVLKAAP